MKINDKLKLDIQVFIYFFFKGTYSQKLIQQEFDYINYLIKYPEKVFRILKIFAEKYDHDDYNDIELSISDIIIDDFNNIQLIDNYKIESNLVLSDFWKEFIEISHIFCFNKFSLKVDGFKLEDFDGNGTDALPYFAVWTNIIEIDVDEKVLNSKLAKQRANERLLLWNSLDKSSVKFEDWELEQQLY